MSNSRGTLPSRPSAAFKPPRSDSVDSLCARTAHSQFEYGSTAWNSLCAKTFPWIVIPMPPMSVQSTASVLAGLLILREKHLLLRSLRQSPRSLPAAGTSVTAPA